MTACKLLSVCEAKFGFWELVQCNSLILAPALWIIFTYVNLHDFPSKLQFSSHQFHINSDQTWCATGQNESKSYKTKNGNAVELFLTSNKIKKITIWKEKKKKDFVREKMSQ